MKNLKKLTENLKKEFGNALLAIVVKKFPKEKLKEVPPEMKDKIKDMIIVVVNDLAYKKKFHYEKFGDEVNFLPLSGMWQALYDGKYGLVEDLIKSEIIYDYGILKVLAKVFALRNKVINKFATGKRNYIVSMIFFGSWARGEAKKDSDIDVAFIIDDTDVKRMTREEVRMRIFRMIAGDAAEIDPNFNIQVYVLTSFWESLRDAHPVMFTLLRDGVPIYDQGLFMPWKILLKTGKIKPTPETVENFLKSSEMLRKSVKKDLKEMVIERLYYSILNLAQAALMFYGVSPPIHSKTPQLIEEHFVKQGLLDKKYARWIQEIVKIRKSIEHGGKEEITGKDVDDWMEKSKEIERVIKELIDKLTEKVVKDKMNKVEELINTTLDELFRILEVEEKGDKMKILSDLVSMGKVPESFLEFIESFESMKKRRVLYEEANRVERDAEVVCKFVLSFVESLRGKELLKRRVRVKYDNKTGEIWFFSNKVFIIKDISEPEKIFVAPYNNGKIGKLKESSIEEFKGAKKTVEIGKEYVVNEETLKSIENIFGKGCKVIFG